MGRYPKLRGAGPDCERCSAPLSLHIDDNRWIGCPYPQHATARHCAYQNCTETVIADPQLWLCNDHLPEYLRRVKT